MFNDTEKFIKVGITCIGTKQRYSNLPYKKEFLVEMGCETPDIVWDIEASIKEIFKKNRINPDIYFPGSTTECFHYSVKDDIINYIIKNF